MKKTLLIVIMTVLLTAGASAQTTRQQFTFNTRTWSTNYWTTLLYNLAHSAVVHFAFDGNSTDSLIVESILPSSDLVFPIGMAKAGFEAPMHDIYGPYHRAFSNPFKRIGDYGIGLDMSWKPVSIGIYAGAYFKSQEICFIPDDDYRTFLRANVPDYTERVRAGEYVDKDGKVLGHHEGYVNYTIGQRKGLGIALGHPAYITHIDASTNRITLGSNDDMYAKELRFKPSVSRNIDIPVSRLTAKIRYRTQAVPVEKIDGDRLIFAVPVWGITPGQSVVLYQDDLVVGGGIILGS